MVITGRGRATPAGLEGGGKGLVPVRTRFGSIVVLLSCALVVTARADDPNVPRGFVRAQGWQTDVGVGPGDADQARSGGSLQGRLDLTEHLRLDLAYARTAAGFSRGQELGYAQVGWRALRVGGGVVGGDWAVHVGAAPRFAVDATRWLRLEGGVDLAAGAAWLDEREGEHAAAQDENPAWRDAGRGGVDLYAVSGAADLTIRLRPHQAVELAVGAYVDAFLAAARPGRTDELPAGFSDVAVETDLGVSATLSQGAVGAHGTASLRLFRDTCVLGSVTEVWLRYREAWDWIHLDPVYTVLARTDPFDDVHLADVPWRTTRTVELTASRSWGGDGVVQATLDVRRVTGSTTVQDFADRDGWSVGARLSARYGRVFGGAHARWHLADSPLEPLLGPMPRAQVGVQGGVYVVSSAEVDVALEGGFELGRQDDWGVPREGHAAWGALSVVFGGGRALYEQHVLERGALLPPLPRRGPPATGRVRLLSATVQAGTAAPAATEGDLALTDPLADVLGGDGADLLHDLLAPADVERFEDRARDAGLLDGPVQVEEVARFLDDPEVEDAVDQRLPGISDVLRRVIRSDGRTIGLDGQALLREPDAVLFAGYGTDSAGVGVGWDTRLTVSRTWNLRRDPTDAEAAAGVQTALTSGDDADLLSESTTLTLGSVLDLARARRWEKLTIAEPDGDRHRVVFQGSTGWTRAMRLLLSGR